MLCNLNSPFENFWVGISEKITVHVVKLYILARFGSIIAVKIVRLETNFDSLPGLSFNCSGDAMCRGQLPNAIGCSEHKIRVLCRQSQSQQFNGCDLHIGKLLQRSFHSVSRCEERCVQCLTTLHQCKTMMLNIQRRHLLGSIH